MTRLVPLLVCLLLAPLESEAPVPLARVTEGAARLQQGAEVRRLEPSSGAWALAARPARLETGARSALELVWRGQASAALTGPLAVTLAVTLDHGNELALERFQLAEIEVRRGTLGLVLELGTLELAPGAVRLRSLPDGVLEILNRGGAALELRRAHGSKVTIPAGQCLRVRAELALK